MADSVTITIIEQNPVTIEVAELGPAPSGSWIDRGYWDASADLFPSGSKRGYTWTISVPGVLGGYGVSARAVIRSLVDNAGQTLSDWSIND